MSRTEQVNFINTWTGFSKLVNGMYIHVCSLLILEVHVYIQDISAADQSNYSSCDLMTFSLEIEDTNDQTTCILVGSELQKIYSIYTVHIIN